MHPQLLSVPGACLPPTAQDMKGPPLAATTPQEWWKWGCTQAPQVTREATIQDGQFRVLPFCRSNLVQAAGGVDGRAPTLS